MRWWLFALLWLMSFPVLGAAAQHGVVILQYHHVGDDTPRVTSITAAELEAHFAYLQEHDYQVVSLQQAQQYIASGEVPDKLVAITFDDGWRNVYDNGLAVFKRYEYPFTIFVNPQLMAETPRLYMDWEQLKELENYGATVANHSNHHQHMTWQAPDESTGEWLARQQQDVLAAQAALMHGMGSAQPRHFAYPYGEYNPELAEMLAEQDFIAFGQHSGPWGPETPLTEIPRFPASAQYANLKTLATKLASLPLPVLSHAPASMVLDAEEAADGITVQVRLKHTDDFDATQLGCFYQGERVAPKWQELTFALQLEQLPIGRSRVNCTVPSKSEPGRFYWYSVPLVRPNDVGRWPD
ncbi:polysaccharide deacetylase family protein [Pseudidiomarina insulisalsae]|uniref:Polysaccharide deacetylase n=1 Tax=Pseudidiomarina insulisalsae TaxID=575789 RepID=A0A432YQ57_9GAMM|nr:polysaccharide deacetylase family protein [Pseudidiomarina insulisalsae]RUO63203.1 polysaccharide deacetylase [Pseudidiomarina insulisalsae]